MISGENSVSYLYDPLDFLNQKFTTVNSTRAAKTKAMQRPSHTSMACNTDTQKSTYDG